MDNSPKSARIINNNALSSRKTLETVNVHLNSPIKDNGQTRKSSKIIACNLLGINPDLLILKYDNKL